MHRVGQSRFIVVSTQNTAFILVLLIVLLSIRTVNLLSSSCHLSKDADFAWFKTPGSRQSPCMDAKNQWAKFEEKRDICIFSEWFPVIVFLITEGKSVSCQCKPIR